MESSFLEPSIFRHPRPKRSVLPPANKKRKIEHKIEQISFDDDARADFLTGFHKRKVARAKQAQAEAAKKAKEERIVMRKRLREERQQELKDHVNAVNSILGLAGGVADGGITGEDEDGWGGIEDREEPKVEVVDHEAEYVDEDRYTTVTVEEVDVSKEGLQKVVADDGEDENIPDLVATSRTDEVAKKKWPKKPRKQKFRYESKAERKFTRAKQKFGNKSKADARKGDS